MRGVPKTQAITMDNSQRQTTGDFSIASHTFLLNNVATQ